MSHPDNDCYCHAVKYPKTAIIQSAAMFEAGAAAIIGAEGELLQKLICRKTNTCILFKVNNQIKNIVCCLKGLEEEIVDKIELGIYHLDDCHEDECHNDHCHDDDCHDDHCHEDKCHEHCCHEEDDYDD